MKALSKTKVLSILIIVSLLAALFLYQRLGGEKSSAYDKGVTNQELTNGSNTVNEKEFGAVVEKNTKETSFSTEEKKHSVTQGKASEPDLHLPSPLDDNDFEHFLTTVERDQIYRSMDEVMSTWPAYSVLQEQLRNELSAKLDLENLSNEQLIETAIELREQFWKAGGNFSAASYQHAFKARILLEIAHDREPENMAITDELVETIQTTWVRWKFKTNPNKEVGVGKYIKVRTKEYVKDLLDLRLKQCKRITEEVEKGRTPTWDDFVRANDLAWLLHRVKAFESASDVVDWLIGNADKGQWTAYIKPLETWQQHLKDGKQRFNYQIYITAKSSLDEEFKYGRRLPSFKGPDPEKRGLTPINLYISSPNWQDTLF